MRQDEEAGSLREALHAAGAGPAKPGRGIGQAARKRIGTHLRAMYDTVLQQPVPDRFAALIAQLNDAPPEDNSDGARCDRDLMRTHS